MLWYQTRKGGLSICICVSYLVPSCTFLVHGSEQITLPHPILKGVCTSDEDDTTSHHTTRPYLLYNILLKWKNSLYRLNRLQLCLVVPLATPKWNQSSRNLSISNPCHKWTFRWPNRVRIKSCKSFIGSYKISRPSILLDASLNCAGDKSISSRIPQMIFLWKIRLATILKHIVCLLSIYIYSVDACDVRRRSTPSRHNRQTRG